MRTDMIKKREYDRQYYARYSKEKKVRKYLLQKERLKSNKMVVINYLKDHSCVDCGEKDICTLDFDHVKGVKVGNIADMLRNGKALERIKEEIEKCVVRCANCHRKKTAKENNWYSYVNS